MNTQHLINRALRGLGAGFTAAMLALTLAGCQADSNTISGPPGGGGGGGGLGPGDTTNCAVPVSSICVLGGDQHGHGLVEELLSPTGPLGPIAGEINADDLTEALITLLQNDDGSLVGILTGLFAEGQLQEGLTFLLLGDDEGHGGLANILQALLMGDGEGGGIMGLVGENGIQGLLEALANGSSSTCQAPLGTLCLVEGPNSNQSGLLDLLLADGGVLYGISQHLAQEDLLEILGDMLESDGSLQDLVTGLIADGQLADGLQALLLGEDGEGGGLLNLIQDTLGNLGGILEDLIGFVGGLFGV